MSNLHDATPEASVDTICHKLQLVFCRNLHEYPFAAKLSEGGSAEGIALRWASDLVHKFGFEKVAITLRTSISANDNDWAGMICDGENCYFSKSYHLHIVDRVGGGDSFGAGLIYALLSGKNTQETIEFAVAASCLKHSIQGDFNHVSVDEVKSLAKGSGSGRVQR